MFTVQLGIGASAERSSGTPFLRPERGQALLRAKAVALPDRRFARERFSGVALSKFGAPSRAVASQSPSRRTASFHASVVETGTEMATTASVVEHIVLFAMKPDTTSEAVTKMISALRGLASLDGILGLYAGEAVNGGNGPWTHALYGRYTTKDSLQAYADSKEHMDVVVNLVRPICSDILALDYEAQVEVQTDAISAACLVALKPKEGSEESELVKAFAPNIIATGAVSTSLGMGYVPARAKGYTWGCVSTYADKEAMLASVTNFANLCEGIIESYLIVALDCSSPPTSKV